MQILLNLPWIGNWITFTLVILPLLVFVLVYAMYHAAILGEHQFGFTYLGADRDAKTTLLSVQIVLLLWTMFLESKLNVRLMLPYIPISYGWLFLLMIVVDLGFLKNINIPW